MKARRLYPVLLMLLAAAAAQSPASRSGLGAVVDLQGAMDSNVRNNNLERLAGMEYELSSIVHYARVGRRGGLNLQYQPYVQWVSGVPTLDSFNQIAMFAGHWQANSRWTLSGQAGGGYTRVLSGQTLSGLGLPPGATPEVATPRTREITGTGTMDLAYQVSPRLQAFAGGGYSYRRFPGASANGLTGVRQDQGQAGFSWTASPRTQWGLEADYVNASLGTSSHLAADSLLVNWTYQLSRVTTVQLYAGPEYSQVHDTLSLALGTLGTLTAHMYRVRTYPRVGGSLSHVAQGLSWRLSAGDQVSNGGGAMPFPAEMIDVLGQVAPHLPVGWQLRLGAQGSHLQALAGGSVTGTLWMVAESADLSRELTRHLSLTFDYDYTVQRGAGVLPMAPPVNRSEFSAGVQWSSTPQPLANTGGNAQ